MTPSVFIGDRGILSMMVEFDEDALRVNFEKFLENRTIYKVDCGGSDTWGQWKDFKRVEYPIEPDASQEYLSTFTNDIEVGDIVLAQQIEGEGSVEHTFGFGVVVKQDHFSDSETIPTDPDIEDPLALRVSWVTVADNGEHITGDTPAEFPREPVTAVSQEYFEDLLEGLGEESYPPEIRLLVNCLFAAAARRNLDELINSYIPIKQIESIKKDRIVWFVADEYLWRENTQDDSEERRDTAISLVANTFDEDRDYIQNVLVEASESSDNDDISVVDHALQGIEEAFTAGKPWENAYTSTENADFDLDEWLEKTPNKEHEYFILKTGDDRYEDDPKESYHFKEAIPGCNQLNTAVPDVRFVYLEDDRFYAVGSLGDVETEDRDGVSHYFAEVTQYHEIDSISRDEIREQLSISLPVQYGIIRIEDSDFRHILGENTARDPWDAIEDLLEEESRQAHLYREALAHLVAGKNIVFYGPPGTGKTRAARKLSNAVCAGDYSLVTANSEWSNYQVVGGYAPSDGGFEPQKGFLTDTAADCMGTLQQPVGAHPSWLLIDELNRANLDEAFGDVFTLLDIDYRTSRDISYASDTSSVPVPLSFRILATMNTYDQAQLFSLGYAFRRRFAFVRVPSLMNDADHTPTTSDPTSNPSSADLTPGSETTIDVVRSAIPEDILLGVEDSAGKSAADVAAVLANVATRTRLDRAVDELGENEMLQTGSLDWLQTIVYFAQEVMDRDVIDIGQALLIDAAKYVTAHQLLFPEKIDRSILDQAVVSYLVPQFEHFMPELRRAETIDQDSSASEDFEEVINLANQLGLPETASVLTVAKEDKRVLE